MKEDNKELLPKETIMVMGRPIIDGRAELGFLW